MYDDKRRTPLVAITNRRYHDFRRFKARLTATILSKRSHTLNALQLKKAS